MREFAFVSRSSTNCSRIVEHALPKLTSAVPDFLLSMTLSGRSCEEGVGGGSEGRSEATS